MKRKRTMLILCAVLIAAAVAAVVCFCRRRPFRGLAAEDVVSAKVGLYPPGVEMDLDRGEIEALGPLLQDAVIYRRDQSFTRYAGQGYRTKHAPREALSRYGNQIANGER